MSRKALNNAMQLLEVNEDGALYLQKVCSMKELKALKARTPAERALIGDAITYKRALRRHE